MENLKIGEQAREETHMKEKQLKEKKMPTARAVHRPTTHQTKHHKNDGENNNNDENKKRKMIIYKNNNEACLLYTSPSPRDGATSRMPSSA